MWQLKKNGILKLKKLRIAFFENANHDTTFELDCALLEVLGLGQETSLKLIGKLRNLKILNINHTALDESFEMDEDFFDCSLKTCRRTEFIWHSDFLNQQQLDRIPNYLQNLQTLEFKRRDAWKGNLNFDFVAKLKNLRRIEFYFNIPKKTMRFLLVNCSYPHGYPYCMLILHGKQAISMFRKRNPNDGFVIVCSRQLYDWAGPDNHRVDRFDQIEDAIEHYFQNDLFNTPWIKRSQIKSQKGFCGFVRFLKNLLGCFFLVYLVFLLIEPNQSIPL